VKTLVLQVGIAGLIDLAACGSVADHSGAADAAGQADAGTCAPTPAGLVARWRGDMSTADDLGRYSGTAVGHIAYTTGRHGSAFALNGTDAVIGIAEDDALWPAGSFSVEGWVSAMSASHPGRLVTKYDCGGKCTTGLPATFSNWSLDITAEGRPHFVVRSAPNVDVSLTDPQHVITDGAWHHLVGVRDIQAKQLTLYVDGAMGAFASLADHQLDPLSNIDGEVDPVTIGASRVANTMTYLDYLLGAVDEVAYFSAAITADQVKAIYEAPDGECQ
jgi:hypothetical protein